MIDPEDTLSQYTDQSASTIHHALRAPRRRLIIVLVTHRSISASSDDPDSDSRRTGFMTDVSISVRDLARKIVSIENDISENHATGAPYHNTYTALIQTHLPFLDDVGALYYNSNRKIVRPDTNLMPLAIVLSISSPVAQMIFHDSMADLYTNRPDTSSDD